MSVQSTFARGRPEKLAAWLSLGSVDVRPVVHRFGLLLCFAAILPFVPQADARTAIFVAALAFLLGFRPRLYLDFRGWLGMRSAAVIALMALAAMSIVWFVLNGGEPVHWLRAIVPFLFLLTWFWLPRLRDREAAVLARWLLIATTVWVLRLMVETVVLASTGSAGHS
jgi:hypothetical protein